MAKVKAAAAVVEDGGETNEAPAAPAEKKERASNVTYKFEKDIGEGQKFAPQAVLIVKHVKAAGTIARKALCDALGKDPDFKTKQPVERIVSYYQKDLMNAGILSMPKAA
jgi:hypothetical protein